MDESPLGFALLVVLLALAYLVLTRWGALV